MKISIQYNWPIGEDLAIVGLGQANVEDIKKEFRIGVVPKEHPDKVVWYENRWLPGEEINETKVNFGTKRGDKVIVERRSIGGNEIDFRSSWDIEEHWPVEAFGPTTSHVSWHFRHQCK